MRKGVYKGMEYKVNIREMQKADVLQASEAVGKALAMTPGVLAIYGGNPTAALRFQIGIEASFKYLPGTVLVAELDGQVVGAMQITKWPACHRPPSLKMMLSALSGTRGLGQLMRTVRMMRTLGIRDPNKPHWHLKSLGVAPDFQGKGIGSQMVKFYCDLVDRDGIEAYHETGTKTVRFYERFGFKVVGEETIIGVKNYYMLRPAKLGK
jgi:ribosomal protein S18 acetylase RimI-like enzyme